MLDRLYRLLEQKLEGVVLGRDQFSSEHHTNFGHPFHWVPRLVVRPACHQDVVETIRFAREYGVTVSTRGPDGPEQERFWSVVAGLGQVAIAMRLRLQLRSYKPMTRTYNLLYDDIRKFMADSEKIMDDGRWDHIESWS
jgi:FAD/FMN-containing dehydrogenase